MLGLAFVTLGLLVSRFLDGCIEHLPLGQPLGVPWSRCPKCPRSAMSLDSLPLLGFVLAHRRCRQCGSSLPWRQLVVEIVTPGLFALLWVRYGWSWELPVATAYVCLFVVVLFIDLEHRVIPNQLVYPAVLVAAALSPLWPELSLSRALIGGVVGFLVMLVPCLLGGMGFGDVKLAGLIGVMVGFPLVFVALAITILSGGGMASLMLVARRKGRKDTMAYGPFLALAGVVTLLYGQPIWQWYILRF